MRRMRQMRYSELLRELLMPQKELIQTYDILTPQTLLLTSLIQVLKLVPKNVMKGMIMQNPAEHEIQVPAPVVKFSNRSVMLRWP